LSLRIVDHLTIAIRPAAPNGRPPRPDVARVADCAGRRFEVLLVRVPAGLSLGMIGGCYDDVANEILGLDGIDEFLVYLLPVPQPSPPNAGLRARRASAGGRHRPMHASRAYVGRWLTRCQQFAEIQDKASAQTLWKYQNSEVETAVSIAT
jgi:hypothetical protein